MSDLWARLVYFLSINKIIIYTIFASIISMIVISYINKETTNKYIKYMMISFRILVGLLTMILIVFMLIVLYMVFLDNNYFQELINLLGYNQQFNQKYTLNEIRDMLIRYYAFGIFCAYVLKITIQLIWPKQFSNNN